MQRRAAGHQTDLNEADFNIPNNNDSDRYWRVKQRRAHGNEPGECRMAARLLVEQVPSGVNKSGDENEKESPKGHGMLSAPR